jgi:hypothetical protein
VEISDGVGTRRGDLFINPDNDGFATRNPRNEVRLVEQNIDRANLQHPLLGLQRHTFNSRNRIGGIFEQ